MRSGASDLRGPWTAKSGDFGELKQFASSTLPVLKEHLTMVQALAEKNK